MQKSGFLDTKGQIAELQEESQSDKPPQVSCSHVTQLAA